MMMMEISMLAGNPFRSRLGVSLLQIMQRGRKRRLERDKRRRDSHRIEPLEARCLLSAITVNTTDDTPDVNPGDGVALDANGNTSLRAAIMESNALAGADQISFDIPTIDPGYNSGTGVFTIAGSTLPAITDTVTIDGYTQLGASRNTLEVGNNASLKIVIDGQSNSGGLRLLAGSDGSTISGLVIHRIGGYAIDISGSNSNHISGNFIGTDYSGSTSPGNSSTGVIIRHGSQHNLVGTDGDGVDDFGERNVIVGSYWHGVEIVHAGSDYNTVAGNYIGTNASGTVDLGNRSDGVAIWQGAKNNIIGTDGSDDAFNSHERNVISGNNRYGVHVLQAGTTDNVIAGNYIGTNAAGTAAIGNSKQGIFIPDRAHRTRIGTNADGIADEAERNVISGNLNTGIYLNAIIGTQIAGNFIGTDATGTYAVGNRSHGIYIVNESTDNVIGTNGDGIHDAAERNVISGNTAVGVYIAASQENVVAGNYIGTDVTGTADLGNGSDGGVRLTGRAFDNRVGSNFDGVSDETERNIISGNTHGVRIDGPGTNFNKVAGNHIGVDANGNDLGNDFMGIFVLNRAKGNVIDRNVLSGNDRDGVRIDGTSDLTFDVFQWKIEDGGNDHYYVVNTSNSSWMDHEYVANQAGGNLASITSANEQAFVHSILQPYNRNFAIGFSDLDDEGTWTWTTGETSAYTNWSVGQPNDAATWNPTGEDFGQIQNNGTWNDLSANSNVAGVLEFAEAPDIELLKALTNTAYNVVAGNIIGLGPDGLTAVGNSQQGVRVILGASHNIIGVSNDIGSGNIVSANKGFGIIVNGADTDHNTIAGNTVGLAADGETARGNGTVWWHAGIVVNRQAEYNLVGTDGNGVNDVAERNVVSGNKRGIVLDFEANYNTVAGNYVGTNAAGNAAVANTGTGISTWETAFNTFGGTAPGSGNLISGNEGTGLWIGGTEDAGGYPVTGHVVQGNIVGLNAAGNAAIGNGGRGIGIYEGTNQIGGSAPGAGNIVSGNAHSGIEIVGSDTFENIVEGNIVGTDISGQIDIGNGWDGINIQSSYNRIGTDGDGVNDFAERNLISGSAASGIAFWSGQAHHNTFAGNIVGTDIDGESAIANFYDAVHIGGGAHNNIIGTNGDGQGDAVEGNLLSGNDRAGVFIRSNNANNNVVAGNTIGLAADGQTALGNQNAGIYIETGSGNRIGTDSDGVSDSLERNVISGNVTGGVVITNATSIGNVIAGNFIGTDVSGTRAVGNGGHGVHIANGASSNLVGVNASKRIVVEAEDFDERTSGNVHEWLVIPEEHTGLQSFSNARGSYLQALPDNSGSGGNPPFVTGPIVSYRVQIDDPGTYQLFTRWEGFSGNSDSLHARILELTDGLGGQHPDWYRIGFSPRGGDRDFDTTGWDGTGLAETVAAGTNTPATWTISEAGVYTIQFTHREDGVAFDSFILQRADAPPPAGHRQITSERNADGVFVATSTLPGARNVISGNELTGIAISNSGTVGNVVAGNYVGTDLTGQNSLGNGDHGIIVSSAGSSAAGADANVIGGSEPGAGNLVSGNNGGGGVTVAGSAKTIISGNTIGLTATGDAALPNRVHGVWVLNSSDVTIGGSTSTERNIISGNASSGVAIDSSSDVAVSGNFLGTDRGGTQAIGNTYGVLVAADSRDIRIGTDGDGINDAGERNLISGHADHGILVAGATTFDVSITGNLIGTQKGGTLALANAGDGVHVADGATSVEISGNLIAFSGGAGVGVATAANATTIRANSIHSNVGLGIDLGSDGVTPNDPGDVDTGPNGFQNFPVFGTGLLGGAQTRVVGTVSGTPNETITVDFYAGPAADPTGFGEGRRHIGSTTVTTDASGVATFDNRDSATATFTLGATFHGEVLTATATGADGSTSEFSLAAETLFDQPPAVDSGSLIVTVLDPESEDSAAYGTATTTVPENQVFRLDGQFSNPDPNDAHTVVITWGDGTVSTLEVPGGEGGFSASHQYVDDDPTISPSDTYDIEILVTDDDGGSGAGGITVTVQNVAPTLDGELQLEPESINEGSSVTLSGDFIDPGIDDAHTVSIDWGDGSAPEVLVVPTGARSFSSDHTYQDNHAPAEITVTLRDDDGGATVVGTSLTVSNVAPSVAILGAPGTSGEGTPISVSASSFDPGVEDTISYQWSVTKDGNPFRSGGAQQFRFTPDNDGVYVISLTAIDDDGGISSTATKTIEVFNVAPDIAPAGIQFFDPSDQGAAPAPITAGSEGSPVLLVGTLVDPGADGQTVVVDWGDGSDPDGDGQVGQILQLSAGSRTFSVQHTYQDDSPGSAYTVNVTVTDANGATDQASTSLAIQNVAPNPRIVDESTSSTARLRVIENDPGPLDTFSYVWVVDGVTLAENSPTVEFAVPEDRAADVSVTVTDDDGGVGFREFVFIVASDGDDSVTVIENEDGTLNYNLDNSDQSVTGTADAGSQLIFSLQGGNNSFDGSQVQTSLTILAGDGNDDIVGGSADDEINSGAGDDTLTGGGGNDTYFITHFSDKIVNEDEDGGLDTLNFQKILTGGITLDLSQTGVSQNVQGDSSFTIIGTIENLVGTTFSDLLLGTAGSNLLFGGGGEDSISGGGGDDTIGGGGGLEDLDDGLADGQDTLFGGDGNDLIFGGGGDSSLAGGTGDDTITGGTFAEISPDDPDAPILGDDTLFGGDGNDLIFGGGSNESLAGGLGDDTITSMLPEEADQASSDTIYGGDGNDLIFSAGGNESVDGGHGDDTITANSSDVEPPLGEKHVASLLGGEGNDLIFGGGGDESMDGGSGDDTLYASDGTGDDEEADSDTVMGGDGNDLIFGAGQGQLVGGEGNDLIFGGGGEESIDGGSGDDTLVSSSGSDQDGAEYEDDTVSGGEGNDLIFGGGGNESVDGGLGDDTIVGSINSDTVSADGGDDQAGHGEDTLLGGGGNDLIFGGGGNDSLEGGSGSDTLIAGAGDDTIVATEGDPESGLGDTVLGGEGNDLIFSGGMGLLFGGGGDDTIMAGGDDTLSDGGGEDPADPSTPDDQTAADGDTVVGGSGNDLIFGGGDNESMSGGSGDDTIYGGGSEGIDEDGNVSNGDPDQGDTIAGGSGNDLIFGGGGGESMSGGSGDDTIHNLDGSNDPAEPELADDTIVGGSGNDLIFGADNNESIAGGSGDDTIHGDADSGASANDETASDTVVGGDGNDLIFGGGGNESLEGSAGDDTLYAGDGAEAATATVIGGEGNDLIYGGGGDDSLDGGSGDDTLHASDSDDSSDPATADSDTVYGGEGNDLIFGGGGEDSLAGGDGDDTLHAGDHETADSGGESDPATGDESGDTVYGGGGNDLIFGGGGDDSLDGGAGNDTLVGSDSTADAAAPAEGFDSLLGGDGNDLIFGGSDAESIVGGMGDDTIALDPADPANPEETIADDTILGGEGNDLIFAEADHDLTIGANSIGGAGFSGIERAMLVGGAGDNLLKASSFTGDANLVGGGGNDTLIGGVGDDTLEGGAGDDSLSGGQGNDVYRFGLDAEGIDVVDEQSKSTKDTGDTLDFSSFYEGITLYLDPSSVTAEDPAQSTGEVTLKFTSTEAIENVRGTAFADSISGNELDNLIIGGGGSDVLDGRGGDDIIQAHVTKWVLLEFDTTTDAGEHIYSDEERDAIQARLEADFGAFDFAFTQDRSDVAQQEFIQIEFNSSTGFGPGGRAEQLGWRMVELSGTVVVDVNGFFGTGKNQLPPTSENFVALSSTIAAHELGHQVGLRHHDSLGAIGSGIFVNLDNDRFLPSYSGPAAANQTRAHLLASPASVGTSLIDALGNPSFGQRETIKLAFSESGATAFELDDTDKTPKAVTIDGTAYAAQVLNELPELTVPDVNGTILDVAAINVLGTIGASGEQAFNPLTGEPIFDAEGNAVYRSQSDFYAFAGSAGDLVTIEVISEALDRDRIGNPIDSVLRLYDANGELVAYYTSSFGAYNDDGFEISDSLLLDVILPDDGTYFVEVDTFYVFSPEFRESAPTFNVERYAARNPFSAGVLDIDRGTYELFMYISSNETTGDKDLLASSGDTLIGGAGRDVLLGSSGADRIIGFNAAEDSLRDSSGESIFQSGPVGLALNPTEIAEGESVELKTTFADIRQLTVDWGDGSEAETFSFTESQSSLVRSHRYLDDPAVGDYFFISVTITDSNGTVHEAQTQMAVRNVAPVGLDLGKNVWGDEESESTFHIATLPVDQGTDTFTYSWTVLDPQLNVVATESTSSTSFSYTPPNPGTYRVQVTADDGDGGRTKDEVLLVVRNIAPEAVTLALTDPGNPDLQVSAIDENGSVRLKGSFTTKSANDAHTVLIDWGDGSQETVSLTPQDQVQNSETSYQYSFTSAVHRYVDDNPGDDDRKPIRVTVTDAEGGQANATTELTVNNVAPTPTQQPVSGQLFEAQTVSVNGSATDPAGANDTVTLAWAVFKNNETSAFATGGNTPTFDFTPDDNGTYRVVLTASDEDGGSKSVEQSVEVSNVDPSLSTHGVVTHINEFGVAVIGGTLSDVGVLDSQSLSVNWGDGSTDSFALPVLSSLAVGDTFTSASSSTILSITNVGAAGASFEVGHQYIDDNAADLYVVDLLLTDKDSGTATSAQSIVVKNVDPTVTLQPVAGISESETATLTGTVSDISPTDTFTVHVDWGDSSDPDADGIVGEVITMAAGGGQFTLSHTYADDPAGTDVDLYPIAVTVTDDDGGQAAASTTVAVANLDPTNHGFAVSEIRYAGSPITSTATATDPAGSTDTLTYHWTVSRIVDGQAIPYQAQSTTGSNTYSFVPNSVGDYRIELTVTDEDGGLSQTTSQTIEVLDGKPEMTGPLQLSSTSIDESQTVVVSGTFTDPAMGLAFESFTGEAIWSDGVSTAVEITIDGPTGTFTTSRLFADDEPVGEDDLVFVEVVIRDAALHEARARSADLTLNNVAPTIDVLNSDAATINTASTDKTVAISGSFSDLGLLDTHTVEVTWGDGSTSLATVNAEQRTFTASHTYDEGGIYDVSVIATDDDLGVSEQKQTAAVVEGIGRVGNTVFIVGTEDRDHVNVKINDQKDQLDVDVILHQVDTKPHGDSQVELHRNYVASHIERIVAYLRGGDDHYNGGSKASKSKANAAINISQIVFGGDGNDHLDGGRWNDAIFGGAGSDHIFGRDGNDILVGGDDDDDIFGGDGNDLLIGGKLNLAGDDPSLWKEIDSAITDWANGDLAEVMAELGPIIDDQVADKLFGQGDADELLGDESDKTKQ